MKIALNGTCLSNRSSGARNRFIGIFSHLFRRLSRVEFFIFEPYDCSFSKWFPTVTNVHFIKTQQLSENPLQRYTRGTLYWNQVLKRIKPEIFETFHLPLIKSPCGRTILTIHDIRYVNFNNSFMNLCLSKLVLKQALKKADLVITVSNAAKNEILDFYPKANVSVIYNGVDIDTYSIINNKDLFLIRKKFDLPDKFLFSVGHFEKRKNYSRLLSALFTLIKQGHDIHLVIAGNDNGELNSIKNQISRLSLSSNVKIFNKISDFEVRCLYKLSSLFVFPSVYEGFGIPIIEAMAAQCPMVISDLPVFREITENQSVYFNQCQTDSIAETILRVYNSVSEQKRLIDYGSKRVPIFSYENLSEELVEVYDKL